MQQQIDEMLDLDQVQEIYFQLFPTAKTLLASDADTSLVDLFKPAFGYAVDYTTYPNARKHMDLLKKEITKTHDLQVAEQAITQLETSFLVNEMVHLSLMRSFDKPALPFVDEKGCVSNAHNYNTLIFQAEALWGELNAVNSKPISFSCNAGMVYIENETSSAYLQRSSNGHDSVKLFASAQKGAMLTYSQLIKPAYIQQIRAYRQPVHSTVASLQEMFCEEFTKDNGRSYNEKVAFLYSKQLDTIFPKTKHVNIDGVDAFTQGISGVLQDKTSLMHYIFANKPILNAMAGHFAGVKSGWKEPNEAGEYSLFFKLKQEKDNVVTGRDPFYSYDIEEIINGIENKKILPRTALYFIYNFLEVGLISLGGTAQAPYLTELKGRMLNFLTEMSENIETGVFPTCPIGQENLDLRAKKIKETPTNLPIGGLSVAGNRQQQLFSYSDHLSGEPLPPIDLQRITVEDAINATMPTLVTHKCMKPRAFLVGSKEITVPQLSFADEKRYDIIKAFPSKIWTP